MTELLYLTSEEVADLAEMADYVAAARDAFRQRGEGADADVPDRSGNADGTASLISYTAALPDSGVFGGYMFSTGSAVDGWYVSVLYDDSDGTPLAVIDGGSWNPLKTGSAAGVATEHLAREDVGTIGVIGSGSQARAQLDAVDVVRDFEAVNVYSPTERHRESFADDVREAFDVDARAVGSSEDAVAGADILITATKASGTVFDGNLLESGTHVNAVGAEPIDAAAVKRSKFYADHEGRALYGHSAFKRLLDEGEVTEDDFFAELGDVVAGKVPGRESDDEITLFDSTGTGVETVAAAHMLYERAREAGRGSTITMSPASVAFNLGSFTKAYQRE